MSRSPILTAALFAALGAVACSSPGNRPVDSERRPLAPEVPEVAANTGPEIAAAEPVKATEPAAAVDAEAEVAVPAIDDRSVAWPPTVDGSAQAMVASVGGRDPDRPRVQVLRDRTGPASSTICLLASSCSRRPPWTCALDGVIADEVARRMAGLERTAPRSARRI